MGKKALVCDICGGKLSMQMGGIAMCDSCGIEYGLERLREMTTGVHGVVQADSAHLVGNYLMLAQSAHDAGNTAEAESYCNKIIEINPNDYNAWLLKGKAAGWQSDIYNNRFSESVAAFSKAFANAPEDKKEEIAGLAEAELKQLITAMLAIRKDRFIKWPDQEETDGFINDMTIAISILTSFFGEVGIQTDIQEFLESITSTIGCAACEAFEKTIIPSHNGDDGRPNKHEWQRFIDQMDNVLKLLAFTLSAVNGDMAEQIYGLMISLNSNVIDSCAWDYTYTDWGKSWNICCRLDGEAIAARRRQNVGWQSEIDEIKRKKQVEAEARKREEQRQAEERYTAYWIEHAEEKDRLTSEKAALEHQITTFEQEIKHIPGSVEVVSIQKRIEHLTVEKDALGVFKGKEKKALQAQIDSASTQIDSIRDKMRTAKLEIERSKIQPAQARIKAIEKELIMKR